MTTPKYIAQLAAKHLAGTLTPAEKQALEQWADRDPAYRAWLDELDWASVQQLTRDESAYQPVEDIWDNPRLKHHVARPKTTVRRLAVRVLPYAAAIILAATATIWIFLGTQPNQTAHTDHAEDILPGTNRATLTLADGRVIDLDEAQKGIVVGTEAITYDDGSALDVISSEAEGRRDISLLELTTPKGGTYQITLPDGSRVWLNAASTLKYPSRFSGDSREVILDGEAYFDVVSMDRARITDARERSDSGSRASSPAGSRAIALRAPFKVQTAGQTVEVLGTQFNLSAYTDDPETKTTLVEGRVLVRHSERGNSDGHAGSRTFSAQQKSVALNPDQQATVRGAQLEITTVDTEPYTAWKDGRFAFTGKTFGQAIDEIARWYDLEVIYPNGVPDETLFGGAYRNEKLSVILRLLASHRVEYELTGNRLIIQRKGKEAKPE